MREVKYKSDWGGYTLPESISRFTRTEELETYAETENIKLLTDTYLVSGIPLHTQNNIATVFIDDSHWLIIGETGSKKTRCGIKPLIMTAAGARETMIVTDVKGELSTDPKISGWLKHHGINKVVLNFKECNCDGFNILEFPYDLYCKGEKDKAMACVTRLVSSLSKGNISSHDAYWDNMAQTHLVSTIQILFEACSNRKDYKDYINLLTVSNFISEEYILYIEEVLSKIPKDIDKPAVQLLKSIIATPEDRTRPSIISTTNSYIREFLYQDNLLKMMSTTTFDIRTAYEQPTCIFLVIPDETSAYDDLAGIIIDNLYMQLIEVYSEKYLNKGTKPKCKINFICDEFCNVRINDMGAKISASRSREMRWYLVCQSINQLKESYRDAASVIIGNCKNTLFLQSSDYDTLTYISKQCGKTSITESGTQEWLITPEELNKMVKTWEYKDALFIRDDIKYCAKLLDIDQYEFLNEYTLKTSSSLPNRLENKKVYVYTPEMMLEDIKLSDIPLPFTTDTPEASRNKNTVQRDNKVLLQTMLESLFNDLYEIA